MQAFGGRIRLWAEESGKTGSAASVVEDIDRVSNLLAALDGEGRGSLRIYRPQATAAFAPRDTAHSAYAQAVAAMRRMGFTPVERRAGGQLAIYDSHALVIDLVAPHAEPRLHVKERFGLFSAAIAEALRCFAIDARVGQVAGEYCPGDYSVNAGGVFKLAGLAQRIGRRGYHLGAVISVEPSAAARDAVRTAYGILGFPFDPASFGAVQDLAPGVGFDEVRASLLDRVSSLLDVLDLAGTSRSRDT